MVRFLLTISLLASMAQAELKLGQLYKATPQRVNNEDVSPRTKYRYTMHLRAVKGYDQLKISSKVYGNKTLYFTKIKEGYDYYSNTKTTKATIRIDRHGIVYIHGDSDWLRLSYNEVRPKTKTIRDLKKTKVLHVGHRTAVAGDTVDISSTYGETRYVTIHHIKGKIFAVKDFRGTYDYYTKRIIKSVNGIDIDIYPSTGTLYPQTKKQRIKELTEAYISGKGISALEVKELGELMDKPKQ